MKSGIAVKYQRVCVIDRLREGIRIWRGPANSEELLNLYRNVTVFLRPSVSFLQCGCWLGGKLGESY